MIVKENLERIVGELFLIVKLISFQRIGFKQSKRSKTLLEVYGFLISKGLKDDKIASQPNCREEILKLLRGTIKDYQLWERRLWDTGSIAGKLILKLLRGTINVCLPWPEGMTRLLHRLNCWERS